MSQRYYRESDVTADDATLGIADEEDDFIALASGGKLGLDALHGIGDVELRKIEETVDFLNLANLVVGEVAATQTYRVNAGVGDRFTRCLDEWGDVLVDEGATLNHDVGADVAELVDESATTDYGKVVDDDLAGNLCGVGNNHVVANHTVVGDVAIGHDETVVADNSLPFGSGATVDGDALAEGGVVADNREGVLAAELKVLGNSRDYGTGEYVAVFADTSPFEDGDVAADAGAFADLDVIVDCDERINHYAGSNFRAGVDVG